MGVKIRKSVDQPHFKISKTRSGKENQRKRRMRERERERERTMPEKKGKTSRLRQRRRRRTLNFQIWERKERKRRKREREKPPRRCTQPRRTLASSPEKKQRRRSFLTKGACDCSKIDSSLATSCTVSPETSPERVVDGTLMQEINIQRPPTPTRGRPQPELDRSSLAYI